MNINDEIKKAETEHGVGGGDEWFKFSEGANVIRLLSPMIVMPQHFNKSGYKGICLGKDNQCPGCKEGTNISVKWLCWVLDRVDNQIKLAKLPHTIAKNIGAFQQDPDYSFDVAPMPYDISINVKNVGTTEVEYTTIPKPLKPIEDAVLKAMEKNRTPEQIKDMMKEKKIKELGITVAEQPESASGVQQAKYPTPEDEGIDLNNQVF